MNFNDFKYCIVTDERGRPMSYSNADGQLCYCDTEDFYYDVWPLKIVTVKTARKQIKHSKKNRKDWGFSDCDYKLIPVDIKQKP